MKRRGKNLVEAAEPEVLDLVVRGGRVVTTDGVRAAEIGILHGKIAVVAPEIAEPSHGELAADGRYIFPGIVDAYVQFNEPGRTEWEGLAHGSLALAAGGGTCFFDQPFNSEPPVLDAAALRAKRELAEQQACVDFALWGGLVPGNLDKLAGLRDAGAIGFKACLADSGIDSFPRVDAKSLYAGMKRAAQLGMLVAVQPGDDALAARFTAEQTAKGRRDAKAWLASRPVEVELAALRVALEIAGETGCALHVGQVSSPEGIALITEARNLRVDVTAETAPHHLLLNDRDVAKVGVVAKCEPPIRDEKRRIALWTELRAGTLHTVGSGHAPCPPELKVSADFFASRSGVAGVQHGFPLLMNACAETVEQDLPRLAAVLARNVARRFRLDHRKGLLAEGRDADFSLVAFGEKRTIKAAELWTRHPVSPYLGRSTKVAVTHTYVRGNPVWVDGRVAAGSPKGQFLKPAL